MRNLTEAVALLRDENLVWSDDFESIRRPLAELLTRIGQTPSHQFDEPVDEIVLALVEPLNNVPEPLEQWMLDASRQLGIYQQVAGKSETTRNALKKLFKLL